MAQGTSRDSIIAELDAVIPNVQQPEVVAVLTSISDRLKAGALDGPVQYNTTTDKYERVSDAETFEPVKPVETVEPPPAPVPLRTPTKRAWKGRGK